MSLSESGSALSPRDQEFGRGTARHDGRDLERVPRVAMRVGEAAGVIVEIPARGGGEFVGQGRAHQDVGPDADILAGDTIALAHHLAGQQRAGVDGDHDRAIRAQGPGQMLRPHGQGQFALSIGCPGIQRRPAGQRRNVDRGLGRRGQVDDPPARTEPRQQPLRQRIRGEGVDHEPHIHAVRRHRIGRHEHTGIVDQHIQSRVSCGHRVGQGLDLVQARQVGEEGLDRPRTRQGGKRRLYGGQFGRAATVQQDSVTGHDQSLRRLQADAVGRAGDQDCLGHGRTPSFRDRRAFDSPCQHRHMSGQGDWCKYAPFLPIGT